MPTSEEERPQPSVLAAVTDSAKYLSALSLRRTKVCVGFRTYTLGLIITIESSNAVQPEITGARMHGGARRVDVFSLHADRQAGVTHTLVVERERQALRTYTNHYNNATGPASGRLPLLLRRLHRRKLGLVVSQQHKGGVVVEATQLGLLGARAGEAALQRWICSCKCT